MRMSSEFIPDARRRAKRRATNVTIAADVLAEARKLCVNLSEASERGLREAIAEERARRWLTENREAIESSNAYVAANGLPLAKLRRF
jgi:antitoxin CcdA